MAIKRTSLVRLAAAFLLVFLGLQFVRPKLKNAPVTAEVLAPPEVKQILRNSCYSCHSNETELLWFDKIVPAYWLVARDVKEARMHLNFSEIGAKPPAQQKSALFEAFNQVQLGAMPLPSFKRLHPGAIVTEAQLSVLRSYLNSLTPTAAAKDADVTAASAQYEKWIKAGNQPLTVEPEYNGLAFIPDYKNWRVIDSTDRFDNQTMRVILGNSIAVEAVAQNRINSWPDGAAFAKVTWFQQPDEKGFVPTGAFQQVEFMIKDKGKYASTLGWGFGRWRGASLKPYGTSPTFTNECVSCHMPVRNSDYVYTTPLKSGSLTGDLPSSPPQWKVITSAINKRDSTMHTLFGNDLAVQYARTNVQHDYPVGSILSLVTWTQQDDERWFGGRTPAAPNSVEFVTVGPGSGRRPVYAYQNFEGAPLKKVSAQEGPIPNERAAYLLSQRAAVMP